MKKLLAVVIIVSVILSVVGCKATTKDGAQTATGAVYATGFTIENLANGCKKITDGESQSIILVPEGKKAPAGYENLPVVKIAVKRAVILASTFGALMRPLGVLDSLVGSGTVEEQLYLEELKSRYASGQIKYVGGGAMGAPDFEAVQALKPDVVFCSTGYPDAVTYYDKMKAMGLNVVAVNDYLETDPLARLEWIKVFGAFYGKDKEAEVYFKGIEKKIQDIRVKTAVKSTLPEVLWGSIFMGTVYVSGGESYVAKWISIAGGRYVFSDIKGSGSASVSLEELYARGKNSDVFIYASTPPYINSVKEIITNGPVLADLPIIKQGTVYCFQPWFYQISDKIDEIVLDLAFICHPDLFPGHQIKHFMVLPAE
jgi:iron complex transport system substrate-binding protein